MELLSSLDFSALWKYRQPLAWATVETLWMAALGFLLAIPVGTALALGRLKGGRLVGLGVMGFVDVIRFTPLLVQAVWIHFALPVFTGINMTATQSGVLALTLHVSAYVSEILRAGIGAIAPGQWEAGRALGLTERRIFTEVVLPQVWPLTIPALANVAVATFKLTAILGILAVNDLMKVANRVNNVVFRPIEIYTSVAVIYLLIGLALMALAAYTERYYARHDRRVATGAKA
ncbi:MAG: amino acid ABC transporter permease [Rhizobiaceae bacterium]